MTVATHLHDVIDVGFAVGLLGALAKGGDLVLDSFQQAKLQKWMENLTLWLIDLNIVRWYPRLGGLRIASLTFALVIATEMAATLAGHVNLKPTFDGTILFLAPQALVFWPYTKFLSKRKSSLSFVLWNLVISVVMVAVGAGSSYAISKLLAPGPGHMMISIQDYVKHHGPFSGIIIGVVVLFALVMFSGFLAVAQGLVLLVMAGVAFVAHISVEVLKRFMWNVVTYVKGAWAALWIVATVILGVIQQMTK
jgi:hypothetical protein